MLVLTDDRLLSSWQIRPMRARKSRTIQKIRVETKEAPACAGAVRFSGPRGRRDRSRSCRDCTRLGPAGSRHRAEGRGQLICNINVTKYSDPLTRDSCLYGLPLIYEAQDAWTEAFRGIDVRVTGCLKPRPPRWWRWDVGTPREIDQRVIRKISDMMDRLFSQQCWMTNRPERIAEEFLSRETRWCPPLVADRQVGLASLEVDQSLCTVNFKRHFGVRLPPQRQARNEPALREHTYRGQPQCLRQLRPTANPRDRVIEPVEAFFEYWVEIRSGFRQRQRAGTSSEQRLAPAMLELANLMADRRRRHPEFLGRRLEAQMPRSGFEGTQLGKWR